MRDLLQETRLASKDLIAPVFVQEGLNKPQQIASMPDIQRIPPSKLVFEVDRMMKLGISAIILFGLPLHKNVNAESAFDDRGIVQKSIDRKSTRLNSSHANISYAVFCLKKKKKKITLNKNCT